MELQAAQTVLEKEVRRLYRAPEGVPVEKLDEPMRTYVQYALETVLRGRIALDEIRPYRALSGIRFLDAGCAYGGFLAAAAEAGAQEVVGVELDDRFLDIARPFLAACGVPHQLEKGDASDVAFLGGLGGFDIITCNDVIEHVESVPRLVESLAGVLNAGGCLYIAAPNRMCPEFIRKDPHFQFFGIVLLPPESAKRYQFARTRWPHYDVGDYFPYEVHRALLQERGLEVDVINVPQGQERERIADLEAQFREIEETGAAFHHPDLPEDLIAEVRAAVKAAVEEFRNRVARFRSLEASGPSQAAETAAAEIVRDFAVPVWHLVARRPAPGGYQTETPTQSLAGKLRRKIGRLFQS